ncbi:MAG TPA: hypothetical protein VGM27_23495 [Acidobacteriaceae bacterium]
MGSFLFQFVMGCRHRHQSRPFTLDKQTYKVCLECGMVIHYSLERMAPLGAWEQRELGIANTNRRRMISSAGHLREAASGVGQSVGLMPGTLAE